MVTKLEALLYRVGHRPFFPKTIGVRIGGRFRDGVESQQVQRLTSAIIHSWNSEGATAPPVLLGDVDALEGLRLIFFCAEFFHGLSFLLWRVEFLPVHAGSAPTGVFHHSSDSETTRAIGASEDELQGADFPLLALLLRLYDPPLQTTHVAIGSLPFDGTPVNGLTQARASSAKGAASSSRRIPVDCIIVIGSRTETPRGSQHGYPHRDVVGRKANSMAIPIITTGHWLFPRSHTRPPVGLPCG